MKQSDRFASQSEGDNEARDFENAERAVEARHLEGEGVTRRSLLKGGAVLGAVAAAGAALAGCGGGGKRSSAASSSAAAAADGGAVDLALVPDSDIAPGRRASADLKDAQPIAPVSAPENWDGEADIVVVGLGGGGLAASLLATDKGKSVIAIEKQSEVGGCTQHANIFVNLAGTAKEQQEQKWAVPAYPYDRGSFLRWYEPNVMYSADDEMVGDVAEAAGRCLDWMVEKKAPITCIGAGYEPTVVFEGKMHKCMSFREVTQYFGDLCDKAGVDTHLNCALTALVTDDDGRVIGVQANEDGSEVYFKANTGVILCSGGIGMNPDMLKKYIPTAYYGAVIGGPMPYHTGEATRAALGCGADMAGIDSWCMWESEPDNDSGNWTYFWGARQVLQLPWMKIDKRGKHVNHYEWDEFGSGDPVFYQQKELPFYTAGEDRATCQSEVSRMGHRAYMIFDGKFEDYMWDMANPPLGERRPITAEEADVIPEAAKILFNPDWKVEFQNAIDDGRIKQAETLEDLAEQLGLDPEILKGAVDNWNKNCETGKDDNVVMPLRKEFLNPIKEAPFYGAKVGGRIGKTLCGLRVDEGMRVLKADGKTIPGLYANFTTAGGIEGESCYGTSLINTSILGGNGLSWATGYLACETACAE